MADDSLQTNIGAEFQAISLDFLVSAPLVAAVRAQAIAADTTLKFIRGLIKDDDTPEVVDFVVKNQVDGGSAETRIQAPILSLVPVPHLRIDSLTTHFTFEISQTVSEKKATEGTAEMSVKTGKFLSPWVSASVKGSISSKSSREATMNRSGQLEITVQASESPIPDGLARILGLLARGAELPPRS